MQLSSLSEINTETAICRFGKVGTFHISEAFIWSCSVKEVFLKISQNSQENICQSLCFNKVAVLMPATLLKKTLVQLFSCGFCEIFMNNVFHRTPLVASSDI